MRICIIQIPYLEIAEFLISLVKEVISKPLVIASGHQRIAVLNSSDNKYAYLQIVLYSEMPDEVDIKLMCLKNGYSHAVIDKGGTFTCVPDSENLSFDIQYQINKAFCELAQEVVNKMPTKGISVTNESLELYCLQAIGATNWSLFNIDKLMSAISNGLFDQYDKRYFKKLGLIISLNRPESYNVQPNVDFRK